MTDVEGRAAPPPLPLEAHAPTAFRRLRQSTITNPGLVTPLSPDRVRLPLHCCGSMDGRFLLVFCRLVDDALRYFMRDFLVPLESFGERRAPLGHRLQRAGVAMQLRFRDDRAHACPSDRRSRLHALGAENVSATSR